MSPRIVRTRSGAWRGCSARLFSFLGHHAKSLAVLTGLGRLDRGIDSKQIRLCGEVLHARNDLADSLCLFAEPHHAFANSLHLAADPFHPGNDILGRLATVV